MGREDLLKISSEGLFTHEVLCLYAIFLFLQNKAYFHQTAKKNHCKKKEKNNIVKRKHTRFNKNI